MYVLTIEFGTPEYDEAVGLRYEILRKPLGLEYTVEQLEAEWDDLHLGAYDDNANLLGYLCLTPLEDGEVKMRQVAVWENVQGKGIGKMLVAYAEQLARSVNFEKMTMHARENAVPFYLKLGYKIIGDPFEEVSIPHFKMTKFL